MKFKLFEICYTLFSKLAKPIFFYQIGDPLYMYLLCYGSWLLITKKVLVVFFSYIWSNYIKSLVGNTLNRLLNIKIKIWNLVIFAQIRAINIKGSLNFKGKIKSILSDVHLLVFLLEILLLNEIEMKK